MKKITATFSLFVGNFAYDISFFMDIYTTYQKYWTSGFEYFAKSEFEREPLMLDKQMIPHFKPLDVGFKISQEQPCSSIRDDQATFLVKSTLFEEEVA